MPGELAVPLGKNGRGQNVLPFIIVKVKDLQGTGGAVLLMVEMIFRNLNPAAGDFQKQSRLVAVAILILKGQKILKAVNQGSLAGKVPDFHPAAHILSRMIGHIVGIGGIRHLGGIFRFVIQRIHQV